MQKLISWIKLLPSLVDAVLHLEQAIPLPASGRAKLDLLLEIVRAFYETEESVRQDFAWDKLAALVTSAVARIVAALNKLGLFRHEEASART